MTERVTNTDVERRFQYLAALCGKETKVIVNGRWNVGAWRLDKNYVYGGYEIQQIANEHGGVSTPFGYERRIAREFLSFMNGVIYGLEMGVTITVAGNRRTGPST